MLLFYQCNYRSYLPCEHMIDCVADCAYTTQSVCQMKALRIGFVLVRNTASDNVVSSTDAYVYGALFLCQNLRSSEMIVTCASFK